ncbi:putative B3 domain-containing protein At5g66980 isoform X2 [Tasmannia lanceolata]|uniref:putative B3 domain-containing protein At5g66980 isoform X2 n=1 Tax=Tasmannia lanceolata TaxID=3420 RepID=UPI0040631E00
MARKPSFVRRPSFFKVMLGDFAHKLRIPPAFIKHLSRESIDKFILRNPTGRFWHVQVRRVVSDLFLQEGWQGFVKDNSLQIGDFLVFDYGGNSNFDIRIYGKSGCEKDETLVNLSSGEDYSYREKENQKERGDAVEGTHIPQDMCSKRRSKRNGQMLLRAIERKEVVEAASYSLKSARPHFSVTLTRSMVYKNNITIPKEFVTTTGLRGKSRLILCDPSGMFWHMTITSRRDDGRAIITGGWRGFARANDIGEGDKCIFEFIQGRGRGSRSVIHVQILRARG